MICKNRADLSRVFAEAVAMVSAGKLVDVSPREVTARTICQNAIFHSWMQQAEMSLPDDDAQGWKRYCKLHHGVPILRADDEDFRAFYDSALKGRSYEEKLKAMEYVPVSSIMTRAQKSRFLHAVRDDFESRGVFFDSPHEALDRESKRGGRA
jgi:hypothetical protein